ncbi:MAG: DUF3343 domain-containing protein [Turicibacter sp.]|nr:DUF3343 domain-containing protein [Turicibacter sp.]
MINESYYLIAFASTHAALRAEAFFKAHRITMKLIPLPAVISAGCGFAIKLAIGEVQAALPLLKHATFEAAQFYQIKKEKGETIADSWVI